MTTLRIPQPTATSTRATLDQEQQLQSLTPEDLACFLALAARLDVLLFAGSMCRHCGHLADHGHAATCPFPDQTETRRPLDVALNRPGMSGE